MGSPQECIEWRKVQSWLQTLERSLDGALRVLLKPKSRFESLDHYYRSDGNGLNLTFDNDLKSYLLQHAESSFGLGNNLAAVDISNETTKNGEYLDEPKKMILIDNVIKLITKKVQQILKILQTLDSARYDTYSLYLTTSRNIIKSLKEEQKKSLGIQAKQLKEDMLCQFDRKIIDLEDQRKALSTRLLLQEQINERNKKELLDMKERKDSLEVNEQALQKRLEQEREDKLLVEEQLQKLRGENQSLTAVLSQELHQIRNLLEKERKEHEASSRELESKLLQDNLIQQQKMEKKLKDQSDKHHDNIASLENKYSIQIKKLEASILRKKEKSKSELESLRRNYEAKISILSQTVTSDLKSMSLDSYGNNEKQSPYLNSFLKQKTYYRK